MQPRHNISIEGINSRKKRGDPVHSFAQAVLSGVALVAFALAVLMWSAA